MDWRYFRPRFVSVLSTQYLVRRTIVAIAACIAPLPALGQDATSRGTLLSPKAFRSAAAKVTPSLVRIEAFGGIAPGGDGGGYQPPGEGPTTGLVISPDGYIITSTFNFVRKPPVITVILADGQRRIAQLLGRDKTRKICLLKVEGAGELPAPQLAPQSEVKIGQWVVAVGIGLAAPQPAISAGIISATSRISGKAMQTDANTSPANYGGPLVDLDGRVIGICVPLTPGVQKDTAGAEWYDSGIGFAVPLDGLESVIERLKNGETLEHAFVGVQVEAFGDPPSGAQIKKLVADSPAAKAGLAEGDKIVSLGKTTIMDVAHLASVIQRYLSGDKVDVEVLRGDERLTKTVALAKPPPAAKPVVGSEKPEDAKKPGQPQPGRPAAPKPERPAL